MTNLKFHGQFSNIGKNSESISVTWAYVTLLCQRPCFSVCAGQLYLNIKSITEDFDGTRKVVGKLVSLGTFCSVI
jgi:hypothetical protein